MKIRYGFVSNSSSSSFTCAICGETQSGMDMGLEEAGMVRCENQHDICEGHQRKVELNDALKRDFVERGINRSRWKKPDEKTKEINELAAMDSVALQKAYEYWSDDGGAQEFCPICMFEKLDDWDALQYLLKKNGLTREQVADQLKYQFGNYTDFCNYIRPPKKD